MPNTRKTVNIDWNATTTALTNGQLTRISDFAAQYGISRPTARRLLSEHYGASIGFQRGRTGGITFAPASRPQPASV